MVKDLDKGILLEDSGTLMAWGRSVDAIGKDVPNERIDQADRIVYRWGPHQVLNGLALNLSNSFWKPSLFRSFKEIESWYVGDAVARSNFERIAKHVVEEFGEPDLKDEEGNSDMLWKWKTPFADLTLYLFEQHALKLHFKIERSSL